MTWLTATPLRIVRAFARMLARLTAEESLASVRRTMLARGGYSSHDARQILEDWQRTAAGATAPPARATPVTPDVLAHIGIRMVTSRG